MNLIYKKFHALSKYPAQRVRLWVTPGRGCFTVERVKSETNLKFEYSNAKNNQENIHFITVYLF